jgi:hypothetical protein
MTTLDLELIGSPSDSVREIATQDGAALLDIGQGICFSVTAVGTLIWRQLRLGQSPERITDYLAQQFPDVPKQQVHDDAAQFIADLRQKGLLLGHGESRPLERPPRLLALLRPRQNQAKDGAGARAKVPRWLGWKAFIGLLAFDLLRLGKNFNRIHTAVRQWPVATASAPPEVVDRICRAINYACVCYPKRVLCLQRSAVTSCLLRNCGVPARMVLGAQKSPFKAHAWTEVKDVPINEQSDVQRAFMVWDRC